MKVILDNPPKGFFERLGQPPLEEKYQLLVFWVCNLTMAAAAVVVLLELGDTILRAFFPRIFS